MGLPEAGAVDTRLAPTLATSHPRVGPAHDIEEGAAGGFAGPAHQLVVGGRAAVAAAVALLPVVAALAALAARAAVVGTGPVTAGGPVPAPGAAGPAVALASGAAGADGLVRDHTAPRGAARALAGLGRTASRAGLTTATALGVAAARGAAPVGQAAAAAGQRAAGRRGRVRGEGVRGWTDIDIGRGTEVERRRAGLSGCGADLGPGPAIGVGQPSLVGIGDNVVGRPGTRARGGYQTRDQYQPPRHHQEDCTTPTSRPGDARGSTLAALATARWVVCLGNPSDH
jgi:hypothetical protein